MATRKRKKKVQPSGKVTHKTELDFKVDAAKAKEIQNCLKKGKLTITLDRIGVDAREDVVGAYIYD